MKKNLRIGLSSGVAAAALLLTTTTQAAEYLVKYRSANSLMGVRSYNMQVLDQHAAGNLLMVDIAKKNLTTTMLNLISDANVEYVVPNAKVKAFSAPVEGQALKQQWAIAKVQAEKAWQRAGNKGSKNVLLAVIDTGADYKHPSLAPNMVPGFDFVKNDSDPMDITGQNPGHGTHCSGIIGATGLIDGGIVGISPELSLMPIRFLDQNGSGDLNNGIKAIDYAIEKHVQIISASWGAAIPRSQAKPLIEAIERAEKAGIVFVVAASNDGKNNDSFEVYPAKAGTSNTIAVAASNSTDAKPSWSNYGKATVDLSSPGDTIMSTLPKNSYGNLSGTSMATPLVAGLVALIKAQDNNLKPSEIRSLLQATGSKVNIETACDCRVDAFEAVDTVKSQKMFVHPFASTIAKGEKVAFTGVYGAAPFQFSSSNAAVASIDASGTLTAVTEGDTVVTVKDSKGQTANSYKIYVGKPTDSGGGGGGEEPPPGGGGDCPIGDQSLCDIICQVKPDLPFCNK